jgi:phytoene dehydrogenase-like protein
MKNKSKEFINQKIAVIGAGASGLFFAQAASHHGAHVEVFESHSKLGGSASYFKRKFQDKTFLFDAGATILWGFEEGAFLNNLFKEWNLILPKFNLSQFLHFSFNNRSFETKIGNYHDWKQSLLSNFPQDQHQINQWFAKWKEQSDFIDHLLESKPHWPIQNIRDLWLNKHLIKHLWGVLKIYQNYGLKSFEEFLLAENFSQEFIKWANLTLLITVQSRADETLAIFGILAIMFYTKPMGSLEAGMFSLWDTLKNALLNKNQKIHMKTPVSAISLEHEKFILQSNTKTFGPYDLVVSSIPRYNTQDFFSEQLFEDNFEAYEQLDSLWSAFVCYWGIEDSENLPHSAFQHHIGDSDLEIYLSFSARESILRSPIGTRCITASSHIAIKSWNDTDYEQTKSFIAKKHKDLFLKFYPNLEILVEDYGTPNTFLHYTRRKKGSVGGYPMNLNNAFFTHRGQGTRTKNLYQIGDTVFPGQSVYSCAIGALSLVDKLLV